MLLGRYANGMSTVYREYGSPAGRSPCDCARTLPDSREPQRNLRSLPDFGCTLDDGGAKQGKIGKSTREDSGESPQIPDYRAKQGTPENRSQAFLIRRSRVVVRLPCRLKVSFHSTALASLARCLAALDGESSRGHARRRVLPGSFF
jgi:hypothetical protein